jgi:hypothetical protein
MSDDCELGTYTFPDTMSFARDLPEHRSSDVALSHHLFAVLRDCFRNLIPPDEEHESLFDRFEILRAMVYTDLSHEVLHDNVGLWAPPGRFSPAHFRRGDTSPLAQARRELETFGADWLPLTAGRAAALLAAIEHILQQHPTT